VKVGAGDTAVQGDMLLPANDEAHRGARQGASGGADCSAAMLEKGKK